VRASDPSSHTSCQAGAGASGRRWALRGGRRRALRGSALVPQAEWYNSDGRSLCYPCCTMPRRGQATPIATQAGQALRQQVRRRCDLPGEKIRQVMASFWRCSLPSAMDFAVTTKALQTFGFEVRRRRDLAHQQVPQLRRVRTTAPFAQRSSASEEALGVVIAKGVQLVLSDVLRLRDLERQELPHALRISSPIRKLHICVGYVSRFADATIVLGAAIVEAAWHGGRSADLAASHGSQQ